jgi:hypothetical protein
VRAPEVMGPGAAYAEIDYEGERMMRCVAMAALAVSFALSGCTYPRPATPAQPPAVQSPAPARDTGAANSNTPNSSATQPPAPPGQSESPQAPVSSVPKPTPKGAGSVGSAAQAASPAKSKPATPGSSSSAPPVPAMHPDAAPPPLDMTSLEQRLKDTRAIGLFTKLSLKNQVDDLLAQFRAFYQKKATTSLSELRQRYDLLLLKVLSLLQDGDPPLATAISGSREAIWSILSDPEKFARL